MSGPWTRRATVPGLLAVLGLLAATAAAKSPTLSFRSAPHLHPPRVSVTSDPDTQSGDIFLAPYDSPQPGPMILDAHGRLIWFHRLPHGPATNLEVQSYQGHPVLTWWQGEFSRSGVASSGEDVILDGSYRTVATLHAGNGYVADPHEFQITPQGTALIDAWVPVPGNLASVGGAGQGMVMDNVIQELDIKTGRVLWQWHSVGHVPLTDSYAAPPSGQTPYDYFHLNSVQQLPDGNLLISARNTWAIYEISHSTGKILWELGGKHSSFQMGQGTNFEWQHDARLHPDGTLTLFDDAALPQEEQQSSAKRFALNLKTMTASLVQQYDHSPAVVSGTQGSAQLLANGDMFVGWGSQPYFSEYSPGGRQIFSGQFALGVESYRAFRFPWHGQPDTKPSMAVGRGARGVATVYASWNGATQVARWRVLGGSNRHHLHDLGTATRRTGFETAIHLAGHPAYLAVQGLASGGRVLGTSSAHADHPRAS